MRLTNQAIALQIVARLTRLTDDNGFYVYNTADDMFKIEHPHYFEAEIEQLIYANLIKI